MKRPINKKAFKRSFWASLGRLIGVVMGAGAGSLLYQSLGASGTSGLGIGLAMIMSVIGFVLIWYAEYEKETSDVE